MLAPRQFHLGRMLLYVGQPLLLLVLWDIVIVIAFNLLHWEWVGAKNLPLTLYGGAVSFIVGFRNNSAYARWWEARTIWGAIVNNSRSIGRQLVAMLHPVKADDPEEEAELAALKKRLVYYQIAFVHALRQQLRELDPFAAIQPFVNEKDLEALRSQRNVALAIQQKIGRALLEAKMKGWLDSIEWQSMDRNVDDLADAQGGAERIKNTPLPKQYDYFPMLFVHIFCIILPVGLVESMGWYTPIGSTVVGFMFLALDKIGRDLEDPFDNTIYDIPMLAITTNIETNLRQILGETNLPEPTKPVNGVLW